MCQHTPEPWEETYNPSDNTWGVCLPEGGDVLAQLIENQADAHLMAAAPAMYAALKAIQAWSFGQPWPRRELKQFTDIDAALAQAEGKG